jgi:hypothetical protein
MRTVLFGLALRVTCLAATPDVEVVVPPSAAHPQDWLHLKIRDNPKPDDPGKPAGSLGEFLAPEAISKIVVDRYAGPPDDVRRYLTAMPSAAAQYFGRTLELCDASAKANEPSRTGASLIWTSTSTVTFDSGRSGRLAVASVGVAKAMGPIQATDFVPKVFGLSRAADCVGFDKVPIDSLYVSYVDPDGYSWAFAVPLQRKK